MTARSHRYTAQELQHLTTLLQTLPPPAAAQQFCERFGDHARAGVVQKAYALRRASGNVPTTKPAPTKSKPRTVRARRPRASLKTSAQPPKARRARAANADPAPRPRPPRRSRKRTDQAPAIAPASPPSLGHLMFSMNHALQELAQACTRLSSHSLALTELLRLQPNSDTTQR